jgi:hypothetical protein
MHPCTCAKPEDLIVIVTGGEQALERCRCRQHTPVTRALKQADGELVKSFGIETRIDHQEGINKKLVTKSPGVVRSAFSVNSAALTSRS